MVDSQYIVEGLQKRGVPPVAAIALAAGASAESGFNPGINETSPLIPGSRGGFGLWQHTGPRRKQLEKFAGDQVADADRQMDFLVYELNNTEKAARDAIYAAKTPEDASRRVTDKFLRPGVPNMKARVEAATRIAGGEVLTGSVGGGGSASGGGGDQPMTSDPAVIERAYRAFVDGEMTPAQRKRYEDDVRSGRMTIPTGMSIGEPIQADDAALKKLSEAFENGQMSEAQAQRYQGDVRAGLIPEFDPQVATPMAAHQIPLPNDDPQAAPRRPNLAGSGGGLDIASDMAAPGLDLASRATSSLFGGEALGEAMIPESMPLYRKGGFSPSLPPLARKGLGKVADLGLAVAGGASAAIGFGTGMVGDLTEKITGSKSTGRMAARELMAVPEAFAGSPGALTRPKPLPKMPKPDEARLPELLGKTKRKSAQAEIANMSKVNPDALAAAERTGIKVPVDVFADSANVKQVSGAIRAINGSDASVEWENAFKGAQQRAAALIEGEGGGPDIAATASRVQEQLTSSIDTLRKQAGVVFDDIKAQIPKSSRLRPNATTSALNEIIEELGGPESLGAPVKRLLEAVTSKQGVTYGRLAQERSQLGRAAFKNQGPYADADTRTLKKLYAALGEDQSNFVKAELGEAAAAKLKNGNQLWSSAKDLEDKLVAGFGKDGMGSIANKLQSAVTNASRGDAGNLNRILDVVPQNLQREAVLTAISRLAEAQSGQGGFSFARYAKTYRGLRSNAPIYVRIRSVIGPETDALMRDLYEVSKRIDEASGNIPRTGASNQPLLAEGLMNGFLNGTTGRYVRGAVAGGAAGAATGNPIIGGTAAVAAQSGRMGKSRADAVSKLFRSKAFQELMVEASKGAVSPKTRRKLAASPQFNRWAKSGGISNPQEWLAAAVAAQMVQQEQENGRAEDQ